jgi:hypothetical protein
MPKVITTCKGVKTEHDIPNNESGFMVLVPTQGVRVDVPEFVEINCRTTIDCMEKMTQQEWEWISTGNIFKHLWKEALDPAANQGKCGEYIPATIEELNGEDPGIIHVAGMIVQGCEALFAGKNVFFRDPETLLHPATERYIVGMFHEMMKLCGQGGGNGTVTKTDKAPKKTVEVPVKPSAKAKAKKAKADAVKDKEQTIKWLSLHPAEKVMAKRGNEELTASMLLTEVQQDTEIGKQVVEQFVLKRDR